MMDPEFIKKLNETFFQEAKEHIQAIYASVSKARERGKLPDEELDNVFRSMHSLKGAARTVGNERIEGICQSAENVLRKIRDKEFESNDDIFAYITHTIQVVETLLEHPDTVPRELIDSLNEQSKQLIRENRLIQTAPAGNNDDKKVTQKAPKIDKKRSRAEVEKRNSKRSIAVTETERKQNSSATFKSGSVSGKTYLKIEAGRLERLLNLSNELSFLKLQFDKHIQDLEKAHVFTGMFRQLSLSDQKSLSDSDQNISEEFIHIHKNLSADLYELEKFSSFLNLELRNLIMVPFSYITESLYGFVNEYARSHQKQINLLIRGAELEADKAILDRLRSPIVHLIRNTVDHGIETMEERKRNGKKETGTIKIEIKLTTSSQLEIGISDDGAGVNLQRIKKKAVEAGLTKDDRFDGLSLSEQLQFIFHPGLSSSEIVTEISGQGLGMSIVKQVVEELGGSIQLTTETGAGTTITLRCPIRTANARGVFVKAGSMIMAFPVLHVDGTVSIPGSSLIELDGKPAFRYKEKTVGLVGPQVFGIDHPIKPDADIVAIVLTYGGRKIGLIVDSILFEEEMILKKPGVFAAEFPLFSAVTLSADYSLIPVVDVQQLFNLAEGESAAAIVQHPSHGADESGRKKILLAEDSATSRNFLKNILEIAGYEVTAAVDGKEAYAAFANKQFDAVVSDIEMPNMNGFELTAKIRQSESTQNLPVILVTSLSSDEDKARGIEAGASAYIVKSQFNQTTLLEVLRRFI